MNEPAVSKTVTKTMPKSNIHQGDDELGGCKNHSHYHNENEPCWFVNVSCFNCCITNPMCETSELQFADFSAFWVYGMLMARSTYKGMKLGNEKKKRPFVLTRAGFSGGQRYAATWTGDNLSTWDHLHMSICMVLQLGLSGQPLSGPDIGGFGGNATPKLFGRWTGMGSMFPFCCGHSEMDTIDHEPWSFGEECEEGCRLALIRRYRLLPHIYTLFYMAHTTGTPVASPTFFTDPKDSGLRKLENSFLLGPLLVIASTEPGQGMDSLQFTFAQRNLVEF